MRQLELDNYSDFLFLNFELKFVGMSSNMWNLFSFKYSCRDQIVRFTRLMEQK